MRNIRDTVTIKWMHNGITFDEELNFYESEHSIEHSGEEDSQSVEEDIDLQTEVFEDDECRAAIILALNDCLEKLSILKCISQKNVVPCPNKFIEYKTIDERFGEKVVYGEEFYSEAKKLHEDQALVFGILYKTLQEITDFGTYTSLAEGTRIISKHKEDEEELLQNVVEIKQLEIDKREEIVNQGKLLASSYNSACRRLHKVKELYEDTIGYTKQELRYADSWETAREHQRALTLEKEENVFHDSIESSRIKMKLEERIHDEIEKYFEENKKDMSASIEYWMAQYEEEVETRDRQLLKLKIEKDNQTDSYNLLKTTYDEHREFVEFWGAIREERRLAAELLERKIYAATKIQAWWRGVMFRKKLSPYRKKKKGKDKGKKKK